jgi:uncharacterized membrane protein
VKTEQSLDRSAMFTALLDLAPGYGRLDTREGEKVTTAALQAWLKTGPEE